MANSEDWLGSLLDAPSQFKPAAQNPKYEASSTSSIVLRGTDGNECEAFIAAIRDLAFTEGRDEDSHWMLRYATTRLRGKAMRWHSKLDSSVRKDWGLFVQALFEEYPSVEEENQADTPTSVR